MTGRSTVGRFLVKVLRKTHKMCAKECCPTLRPDATKYLTIVVVKNLPLLFVGRRNLW